MYGKYRSKKNILKDKEVAMELNPLINYALSVGAGTMITVIFLPKCYFIQQ